MVDVGLPNGYRENHGLLPWGGVLSRETGVGGRASKMEGGGQGGAPVHVV